MTDDLTIPGHVLDNWRGRTSYRMTDVRFLRDPVDLGDEDAAWRVAAHRPGITRIEVDLVGTREDGTTDRQTVTCPGVLTTDDPPMILCAFPLEAATPGFAR